MADNQRIEDLRRRVQRDPASIAFAQLAEECRRAGRHQEAVDVCRAGLERYPGYLSARVTLGRALIELNDLDGALAELEHVLKSAPENLAAIRGLAEIHHRQGSLAQAPNEFLKHLPPPAPAPPPAKPAAATQAAPKAPAPAPPPVKPATAAQAAPVLIERVEARVEAVERPEDIAARGQALQVIAVLEQWLDAIHVARAQPRA